MKLAEIVTVARRLLNDLDPDYRRFDDEAYYEAISIGLTHARRRRPDLFIGAPITLPLYTPADAETEPPMPADYHPLLGTFAAAHLSLVEDTHVASGRAAALLDRFEAELLK